MDGTRIVKDIFIDVLLELNEASLVTAADPTAYIIETARDEADRRCQQSGARLHTDSPPEILIERGQHKETQEQVLLVATRWAVTAPENVPLGR